MSTRKKRKAKTEGRHARREHKRGSQLSFADGGVLVALAAGMLAILAITRWFGLSDDLAVGLLGDLLEVAVALAHRK